MGTMGVIFGHDRHPPKKPKTIVPQRLFKLPQIRGKYCKYCKYCIGIARPFDNGGLAAYKLDHARE